MGAKVCFVLGILLLSHVFIPIEVAAREMLQEPQITEEAKSHIDAHRVTYKPLNPVPAPKGPLNPYYTPPGRRGRPYTRPCKKKYGCNPGPPGP